jgi:hypothetical protein
MAFAKELAKYTSQWVALKDERIVASGKTLKEVQKLVETKNIKGYAFHYVERYPLSM